MAPPLPGDLLTRALVLLLFLAPLGTAQPDFETSFWDHFEGTLVQGEVDTQDEWLGVWYPGGRNCLTSIESVLLTLHLVNASLTDVVQLEGIARGPIPSRAFATAASDGLVHHTTPCLDWPTFTLTGASVATQVRYVLTIEHCPIGVHVAQTTLCPDL